MPAAPIIAYADVAKRFDGGRVTAVDHVSLAVAEGEFLAIVGGSGSGKTTLLRLANRLIEADGGTITVEGEDVRAADPIRLRRRIGYVFQSGALFPHMSVADNIGITPRLLDWSAQDISAHDSGAYTGEISGAFLAKLGCTYAVVGHSERREYHGEDEAVVNAKVKAAFKHGLTPIMCVGEVLEIRKEGRHIEHTLAQVVGG
jgi:ABC-type Fe3+/spermidine/putrescine transport system ATPase subunit